MSSASDVARTVSGAGANTRQNLPYEDLREWIAEAERLGELKIVRGANWQEDIGMATELVSHEDSAPVLLFEDIPGVRPGFRVLSNIFAGRRKNMTLGFPVELNKVELSTAFADAYGENRLIPPVFVEDGPIFENVITGDDIDVEMFPTPIFENVITGDDIDVEMFPTPMWHELDGGRYIGTGSYNVTQDPVDGWYNLGSYRIMLHDKRHVTFNTAPGKHGRIHHEHYIKRGEKMPVVMVVGGDPMTFFLGGTEAPDGVSEFDIVGGLRGKPLELVRGKLTGLPFPANAEIVLEGFVDPTEQVPEGPFGDWTGTYTESGRIRPLTEICAIYHRNDPILLGFAPQSLPDEYSRYRAITRSALLHRNVEAAGVPDVQAVWCHECGGSRMLLVVSIRQRYPGHATQAGQVTCQCHTGAYGGKWVIVVDEDVDVTDLQEVIWAAMTRADPMTDLDFIRNTWASPADPLIKPDERARGNMTNSRMIINACRPFHWRDKFSPITKARPEIARRAREKFGYLLR